MIAKKVGSLATIRRLPTYLHLLRRLQASGREIVSSTHIANELKIEAIQVRKDIAVTGIVGKPKVGYHVPTLIKAIEEFLGWDNVTDAFLVGVGNLGSALLGYGGFHQHGMNIVAAFDTDEGKIGTEIHGKEILPLDKLSGLAMRMHVNMGIITVPASEAQSVAGLMVDAGIVAIWNFAPTHLETPENVIVQYEDLSSGFAVLSVKLSHMFNEEFEDGD